MIKKDLVQEISDKTGLGISEVAAFMDAFIETFQKTMQKKEPIFIRGFLSAVPKLSKYKKGRNIMKNEVVDIPPHYRIQFIPSKSLVKKMKKVSV